MPFDTREMRQRLQRVMRALPRIVGQALEIEANAIMAEAKVLCPVDTGALRASGTVEPAVVRDAGVEVVMYFGGPGTEYAVPVHENLRARHREPTQAKFLEAPLLGARHGFMDRMGESVAEGVERALR